ncbi:MAG: multidrug effflux MFS transporter [Muribaculaceae bacterium]
MNYKVFLLLFLGSISAFGPFVTDMYLPSLPSMVDFFDTSISMVQLGLSFSMIGLALGQLVFGPLSDKYGRKRPLQVAMIVFCISTLISIFSPTIEVFIVLRLLQGMAGAGGIVLSRSIATDTYDGHDLLKMLAIIGAINGIAPIFAPVIGGAFVNTGGWQCIFAILLGIGIVILLATHYLRESLAPAKRNTASVFATFKLLKVVFHNRIYMSYVLQQATAQAILFGNISSAPFIMQEHYGTSAITFSALFAVNGLFIGIGSALSAQFRHPETCVKVSCIGMLSCAALIAVVLYTDMGLLAYELLMNPMLGFLGLTLTASTTLALNSERKNAGSASALFGALCFASGGIVSPIIGQGNLLHTTANTFIVGAVLSGTFAIIARRLQAQSVAKQSVG